MSDDIMKEDTPPSVDMRDIDPMDDAMEEYAEPVTKKSPFKKKKMGAAKATAPKKAAPALNDEAPETDAAEEAVAEVKPSEHTADEKSPEPEAPAADVATPDESVAADPDAEPVEYFDYSFFQTLDLMNEAAFETNMDDVNSTGSPAKKMRAKLKTNKPANVSDAPVKDAAPLEQKAPPAMDETPEEAEVVAETKAAPEAAPRKELKPDAFAAIQVAADLADFDSSSSKKASAISGKRRAALDRFFTKGADLAMKAKPSDISRKQRASLEKFFAKDSKGITLGSLKNFVPRFPTFAIAKKLGKTAVACLVMLSIDYGSISQSVSKNVDQVADFISSTQAYQNLQTNVGHIAGAGEKVYMTAADAFTIEKSIDTQTKEWVLGEEDRQKIAEMLQNSLGAEKTAEAEIVRPQAREGLREDIPGMKL